MHAIISNGSACVASRGLSRHFSIIPFMASALQVPSSLTISCTVAHIREAGEGGDAKPAQYIYSAAPVPVIAYSAGLQSHRLSTIMAAKDR